VTKLRLFFAPGKLVARCAMLCICQQALAQYTWQSVSVGADVEHRFFRDGFHFGTLIRDLAGRLIFRGHPDRDDINGWGTSYFIAPFLAGADSRLGTVNGITSNAAGFNISTSGMVARGSSSTYGSWTWNADLRYDPVLERGAGSGILTVNLPGTLNAAGADLNLERISSNFLHNVPLQTGGTGATGDMRYANVRYAPAVDPRDFTWRPPQLPGHFPQDFSSYLDIDVVGERNIVDTLAQGKGFQIQIADKPSFSLAFTSRSAGNRMIFGGIWNESQGQNFEADNVGINHLITRGSTNSTSLSFDFAFEFVPPPIPGDYNGNNDVDAADYVVWRDSLGSTNRLAADGNNSGAIDQNDYEVWKANFGRGAIGAAGQVSAVPEPGSVYIACIVAMLSVLLPRCGQCTFCTRRFRLQAI
jgi:hypothetical protein